MMGLSSVPPASESGLWSKSGTNPGSRTDEAGASHRWQIGRGVEDGPGRLEEDESRSSLGGGGEGRRPSIAEVSPEADRGAGRSQEEAAWPGASAGPNLKIRQRLPSLSRRPSPAPRSLSSSRVAPGKPAARNIPSGSPPYDTDTRASAQTDAAGRHVEHTRIFIRLCIQPLAPENSI